AVTRLWLLPPQPNLFFQQIAIAARLQASVSFDFFRQ
ncbi:MAG: hypothetical protein ACI95R_002965, partial [Halioglobus sp.]